MSLNTKKALKPFSELAKSIKPNTFYEHYSKKQYEVLGVARHSESLEELVVYQALYGDQDLWVRPLKMFLEEIDCQGELRPRFNPIPSPAE